MGKPGQYGPLLVVAAAIGAFFVISPRIDVNLQTEWLRVWQVVLFGVGFVVFVMSLRKIFASGVSASVRRFLLGLMVFCLGAADGAGWRLMWRLAGRGDEVDWMLTNRFSALLLWLEVIGLAMMISGPAIGSRTAHGEGTGEERVNWRRLGVTAVLCASIGYAIVVGRPDARAVADYLKPWLETARALIRPPMG